MARPSMPTVDSQRPSGPLTFLQPGEPDSGPILSPSDLPILSEDPWPSNPLPSDVDQNAPASTPISSTFSVSFMMDWSAWLANRS